MRLRARIQQKSINVWNKLTYSTLSSLPYTNQSTCGTTHLLNSFFRAIHKDAKISHILVRAPEPYIPTAATTPSCGTGNKQISPRRSGVSASKRPRELMTSFSHTPTTAVVLVLYIYPGRLACTAWLECELHNTALLLYQVQTVALLHTIKMSVSEDTKQQSTSCLIGPCERACVQWPIQRGIHHKIGAPISPSSLARSASSDIDFRVVCVMRKITNFSLPPPPPPLDKKKVARRSMGILASQVKLGAQPRPKRGTRKTHPFLCPGTKKR